MDIIQIIETRPTIKPDVIFSIWNFPFTNSILTAFLITIIIAFFSYILSKKISTKPKKWQVAVEFLYESVYDLIDKITGSEAITKKIFYLIGSLLVFIALSNVIGIFVPFLGSITYNDVAIFRTPTTDFNVTVSLAVAMVLLIQISSIKEWGIIKYLSNYIKIHEIFGGFKKGVGAGFMGIINFMIGLLDIISEFAKVISLSMRLFGNMFAGEMLAVVLLGFLAYGLPAFWMTMNIFVGFVQAIVFASLTAAYYSLAVKGSE